MLVLTRKQQEKIQIGDSIVITVLKTKGKTVRLGIEAPGDVAVLRGELAARDQPRPESPGGEPAPNRAAPGPPADRPEPSSGGSDWNCPKADGVSLQRVPRSRVATVLPRMLGDAGPLRSMLDRRATAPT